MKWLNFPQLLESTKRGDNNKNTLCLGKLKNDLVLFG